MEPDLTRQPRLPSADPMVLVGVCGGISAYKIASLVSALRREGNRVHVLMTASAQRFVGPVTFRALSQNPVTTDMWDPHGPYDEPHVALGSQADLYVIAPATAQTIACLAHGFADDVVTATALATRAPVLLAPAMSEEMWQHPATRRNVARLQEWGYRFVGPVRGRLASGQEGWGRMAEPEEILAAARVLLKEAIR
ncbi:MAG: flavoprotein [Armatimonadota bacterium]|nr:flavoprotein [Armatimonadota bacterium]MDR5696856.1 flavoprotein [Armatimonadota bacterium]